jgi:hypothetical protein
VSAQKSGFSKETRFLDPGGEMGAIGRGLIFVFSLALVDVMAGSLA